MPSEFLRDVTQASGSIPVRRFSMVPLSVAAHAVAVLVVLLAPLAAEVELPAPMSRFVSDYMMAAPMPAPPPQAPAPSTARGVQHVTGAPTVAPESITPERERPPILPIPDAIGVVGGVDATGSSTGFGATIAIEPPPPVKVEPQVPRRPGGDIREPKKIVDVAPVYPPLARTGQVEGVVILEAVINTRGEVERLRLLRSVPLLDAAAIDAVQRWRYTPTLLNGIPVPVLITITVRFALR